MENIYKEGDIVVHIDSPRGRLSGAGWKLDTIWEVFNRPTECQEVVWTESGCGVYPEEVRYATPQEIDWFKQGNNSIAGMPKILNYEIY